MDCLMVKTLLRVLKNLNKLHGFLAISICATYNLFLYGALAQWERITLAVWGSRVQVPYAPPYKIETLSEMYGQSLRSTDFRRCFLSALSDRISNAKILLRVDPTVF